MEDKKLKKVYEKINDIRMMIGGTLSAEGVTHEDFVKDLNYVSEELDKIVDDYNNNKLFAPLFRGFIFTAQLNGQKKNVLVYT